RVLPSPLERRERLGARLMEMGEHLEGLPFHRRDEHDLGGHDPLLHPFADAGRLREQIGLPHELLRRLFLDRRQREPHHLAGRREVIRRELEKEREQLLGKARLAFIERFFDGTHALRRLAFVLSQNDAHHAPPSERHEHPHARHDPVAQLLRHAVGERVRKRDGHCNVGEEHQWLSCQATAAMVTSTIAPTMIIPNGLLGCGDSFFSIAVATSDSGGGSSISSFFSSTIGVTRAAGPASSARTARSRARRCERTSEPNVVVSHSPNFRTLAPSLLSCTQPSSSFRIAAADAKRSSRRVASAFRTMSKSRSSSGKPRVSSAGMFAARASSRPPFGAYIRFPWTSSHKRIPAAKTSLRASTSSPFACSGLM